MSHLRRRSRGRTAPCSPACLPPRSRSARTATCPAVCTTRPRPASRRESVKAVQEKYQANEDPHFRARAVVIKEQRAELAKHHVSVLWSDYFKPPHFEKYPELHQLVNDTLKALSAAKASTDPATGQKALDLHRPDRQDLLGDQEGLTCRRRTAPGPGGPYTGRTGRARSYPCHGPVPPDRTARAAPRPDPAQRVAPRGSRGRCRGLLPPPGPEASDGPGGASAGRRHAGLSRLPRSRVRGDCGRARERPRKSVCGAPSPGPVSGPPRGRRPRPGHRAADRSRPTARRRPVTSLLRCSATAPAGPSPAPAPPSRLGRSGSGPGSRTGRGRTTPSSVRPASPSPRCPVAAPRGMRPSAPRSARPRARRRSRRPPRALPGIQHAAGLRPRSQPITALTVA